ncbi:DUF3298 and DUF4163 domain-containing protein [Mucilaginibacter aquatilis]|uniref:DUF3298 domain-containing protein n=1 Tax=Mucilaginibacter aquatilis TaxID=1517760 RepID=A0A6I4IDM6_9SPHI|nr:DUF3298 and DUF4163 domain-containing protein [Mucilaginibacter aquatilis]MVN93117.1 DUF3298 domain-containing protein [Mucilaginibacter aquatilis]
MRTKFLTLISIAGLSLTACVERKPKNDIPDVWQDTLTYQFKTINAKADDCAGKPDSACTTIKFRYPAFDNQPLLNDTVVTGLSTLLDRQKGIAGLQRLSWQFLQDYKDFKKQNPKSPAFFELNSKVDVIRQDSSLLNLEYNGYQFTGGAHGMTIVRYLNWDVAGKKKILLSDIFRPGYEDELNKIAEQIFRKQENLSETASLANNYFFKDAKFSLNQNFLITPVGITFLYNQYEIKPYAAGRTTLEIPYEKIKTLLKQGTVTARYN